MTDPLPLDAVYTDDRKWVKRLNQNVEVVVFKSITKGRHVFLSSNKT